MKLTPLGWTRTKLTKFQLYVHLVPCQNPNFEEKKNFKFQTNKIKLPTLTRRVIRSNVKFRDIEAYESRNFKLQVLKFGIFKQGPLLGNFETVAEIFSKENICKSKMLQTATFWNLEFQNEIRCCASKFGPVAKFQNKIMNLQIWSFEIWKLRTKNWNWRYEKFDLPDALKIWNLGIEKQLAPASLNFRILKNAKVDLI